MMMMIVPLVCARKPVVCFAPLVRLTPLSPSDLWSILTRVFSTVDFLHQFLFGRTRLDSFRVGFAPVDGCFGGP